MPAKDLEFKACFAMSYEVTPRQQAKSFVVTGEQAMCVIHMQVTLRKFTDRIAEIGVLK
jgi:hypothetical protein